MKLALWDRIIFLAIAVILGIICAKMVMPTPVRAQWGEIVSINLAQINGSPYGVIHLLKHLYKE